MSDYSEDEDCWMEGGENVRSDFDSDSETDFGGALLDSTNAKKKSKAKGKTVEEIYQKVSQLEHILLRPDTYST